jgi:hypothetical protein
MKRVYIMRDGQVVVDYWAVIAHKVAQWLPSPELVLAFAAWVESSPERIEAYERDDNARQTLLLMFYREAVLEGIAWEEQEARERALKDAINRFQRFLNGQKQLTENAGPSGADYNSRQCGDRDLAGDA